MLYRDTESGALLTDRELVQSLREGIAALDYRNPLKRDYEVNCDTAIYEYILDAALVGMYVGLDGSEIVFRRTRDGELLTADEIEAAFEQDVCDLLPDHRAQITFASWLGEAGFVESAEDD